uniref:Secreted protein n=1 Tax=Manihot esculenta TaxID=3983 RepID=A0A2C9VB69_MANES
MDRVCYSSFCFFLFLDNLILNFSGCASVHTWHLWQIVDYLMPKEERVLLIISILLESPFSRKSPCDGIGQELPSS